MKITPNIPNLKPNKNFITVRHHKTQRTLWNCPQTHFLRRFFCDPRNVFDRKISQFNAIFNPSTSPESPFNLPGGVWWFWDPRVTSCGLKLRSKWKELEKRRKSCAFSHNFDPLRETKNFRKVCGDKSTICWGYPASLVELGAFWGVLWPLEFTSAPFL